MATLKDVKEKFQAEVVCWNLYGATAEWQQKVRAAFRLVGQAIMKEQNVGIEHAHQLPPETQLGPKAEAAFQAFRALLESDAKHDEQ